MFFVIQCCHLLDIALSIESNSSLAANLALSATLKVVTEWQSAFATEVAINIMPAPATLLQVLIDSGAVANTTVREASMPTDTRRQEVGGKTAWMLLLE